MEENYNIKQLSLYILIIMAILLIFYGITVIVTNNSKENSSEVNDDQTIIDYEEILVQNIYSQKEETYYVLASLSDDENLSSYNNSLSVYEEMENSLKVYTINLSSSFNKKYLSEQSDFNGDYPLFKETTLLKIENKKITESYEGEDQINTILSILIDE